MYSPTNPQKLADTYRNFQAKQVTLYFLAHLIFAAVAASEMKMASFKDLITNQVAGFLMKHMN